MSEVTLYGTYPRGGKNLTKTAATSGGVGARPMEEEEDRRRKKELEEPARRIASTEEEDVVGVKAADAAVDDRGVKCASCRVSS